MAILPFPRRFIAGHLVAAEFSSVSDGFDQLEREIRDPGADLERWLAACSELASALAEERERRMVAMTCRTDDPAVEKRFEEYVLELEPKLKPRWFALNTLFLAHPRRGALDRKRWAVLDRAVANEVGLYRPENVALEAEEERLQQQYNKIAGAQTARLRGEEKTLTRLEAVIEEPDRALRQEAWEAIVQRRLVDRDALDGVFDQLVALRHKLARNAGLADYRAFAFRKRERFDYTPEHCLQFHRAVERAVVPRLRALDRVRKQALGVEPLRPWDKAVDPLQKPALRPFTDAAQLYAGCREMFARVHPDFAGFIETIHAAGNLDLDNRRGKAPGGYQTSFEEARLPFIFMNAAGVNRDVITLLHEGGHAFHYLLCRTEPILKYRYAPIEFCEVASMGMELLAVPGIEVFYPPADARRARLRHFERVLQVFAMVAHVDAFQHWIYAHPQHSRDERTAAWRELQERFGGLEDWTGHETARDASWQRILHLFTQPFYFIEYGIAQTGALQLWSRFRRDPEGAVAAYRRGLSLGGTRPLPELFAAADIRFDFSEATIAPLIEAVEAEMAKLS